MYIKIKPTELKNIKWLKHQISSDGFYNEKETFIFPTPLNISLECRDSYQHVRFNQLVERIIFSHILGEELYGLRVIFPTNDTVSFTTEYPNYYYICIYTDDEEIQKHLKNIYPIEKYD